MELIKMLIVLVCGLAGMVLTPASIAALTYNPENPDWSGFFVVLFVGLAALTIATVVFNDLKKNDWSA